MSVGVGSYQGAVKIISQTEFVLIATVVFWLAGLVKGTTGLGLPTLAIGLLTLVVGTRTAVAVLLLPVLFSNGWQMYRGGETLRAIRDYRWFIAAMVVVMWITANLSAGAPERLLYATAGAVLILFVAVNLTIKVPRLPDRGDLAAQLLLGTLTGITGGLTALYAPSIAIYLTARHADKDEFLRVTGLLIFIGAMPLIAGYVHQGLLTGPQAVLSLFLVVPTLIGFACGEYLRNRISTERFRVLLLGVFLLLGANLLRKAFF
ncbi:MAG: sulfite exporter TauE/SafE family protein [Rhodobacteraceae bacterium]|nr:sulfite exporter TauE/SafE family protein [Paracoccaceae bacterium]